ncbi:MAG TPA: helix-turn-helix transcriptional regulator [Ferrovibrio sp.]|uniref:helix-turn-helix transcriptional regulator n=1 Tax=Ferrovibrio sp. TaxID=1917215 RepID=UPI002ED191E7
MKASDRNKLLGRRIRELRKERGLTQEQLSEKVGKTDEVISNIETGAASTRLSTLFDIADALKVSLLDIFDWVTPRKLTADEIRQEELVSRVRKILRSEIAASAEDLAEINTALVRAKQKKSR